MKQNGIPQESLKLIACVTMLLDHIGAILVKSMLMSVHRYVPELLWAYYILRCIGRTAFPIFCFLLVEGVSHTHDPKRYALRLAVGAVLAEIPFDLAFYGELTFAHSNVMVTLLLGFGMIQGMKRVTGLWKLLMILPFYLAAEWLHTDYAGEGILMIALFALVRETEHQKLLAVLGMVGLVIFSGDSAGFVEEIPIYLDRCKLLSLLPIFAYNGQKISSKKALQLGFYLLYPVHILVLYLIDLTIV